MKLAVYDSITHIDDNKILVNPQGISKAELVKRLNNEPLIASGKFTASGREYCNFAPLLSKADIKFTTLAELESAL